MSLSTQQFSASGITARLFELISGMSEAQKKDLLLLIGDQRRHSRLPYLMQVTCETDKDCFMDFILDISPGGVFLETIQELFVGQRLKMTFQFRNAEEPMVITGNVAWIGVSGAGIRFIFDSEEQKRVIAEQVARLG